MADYSRQPTRSSFAFATAQPVETRSTLDPGFRGGGVVGGDSQGGVVRGTPFTLPSGDDGIPDFLQRLAEPYIRARQSEMVVKGATDFAAGKPLKDIAKGDSGIASIFGPSGYHQGAAAFAATDAWAKTKDEILNDDDLAKLGPDELSKHLAQTYQGMMTGDPVTDQLLQHTVMTDHGALVQALTAKHEVYVQNAARLNWSNTQDATATALQSFAGAADLSSPSGQEALRQQTTAYATGVFSKPHGMATDVYQKAVAGSASAAVDQGNFYAYEALKANGLSSYLSDEQQVALDAKYQAGTSRAFAQVASDPEISRRLATLDMQIRTGLKSGATNTPLSLPDIDAAVAEINGIARAKTGIQGRDFVSGDDLTAMHKQSNEGVFSAGLRLQSHQWELEKEQRGQAWDIEKKQIEDAEKLRIAASYAGAGNVASGLATGTVQETDANLIFGKAAAAGDMRLLAHNFASGSYVNKFAASQLQGPVSNSIGHGVTAGFRSAYKQWSALHAANPAAAAGYFGDFAANMEGYDRLLHGGETELSAYAQTFGKPTEPGAIDLPEGVNRRDAVKAVTAAVQADDRRYLGIMGSRTPLSSSAQNLVTEWLLPKAGAYARQSGVSIDQAAHKLYAVGLANGEIERAGPLAWTNRQGATKIGQLVGLPDDATDRLVTQVANDRLVKAGFAKGTSAADYRTLRIDGADGRPALYIQAMNDDFSGHTDVLVTLDDLKLANRKNVQAAIEAARPKPVLPSIDVSNKGIANRRDSYRHAMDAKPGDTVTDLGQVVSDAAMAAAPAVLEELRFAQDPGSETMRVLKQGVKNLQDYSYRQNHPNAKRKRPK